MLSKIHIASKIISEIRPAIQAAGALESLGDAICDTVEEFVQRTDNTIDDAIILPMIKGIRTVAGIEDNDDPNLGATNEAQ